MITVLIIIAIKITNLLIHANNNRIGYNNIIKLKINYITILKLITTIVS